MGESDLFELSVLLYNNFEDKCISAIINIVFEYSYVWDYKETCHMAKRWADIKLFYMTINWDRSH